MPDWTSGYVADIAYTYGYYAELNPLRIKLAFINAGLVFPDVGVACELGFGQGLSANIHAAATVTEWHGTDFNPAQAGFAQELARVSGAKATLVDEAFAVFCARTDLPQFDSIGLHGIWSWINDDNRAIIVDFIGRKLKVGGVLYISYNTLPGLASMVPLRGLLTGHAQVMGASGQGMVARIDAALDFTDRLLATAPAYLAANPATADRVAKLRLQSRNYLAHEYFNRDWLPMSFSSMAEWLAPAKLDYACSTNYHDHIDALNLSAEQGALLAELPDRMFRETVRDFMVNQGFRRDYWVRGARKLGGLERTELVRAQRVMLTVPRADVSLAIKSARGDADMHAAVYAPILDLLADHQPRSLGELEQALAPAGLSLGQIFQAVLVLAGAHSLYAVQDDAAIAAARVQTDRLNAHICLRSRGAEELNFLASPVTGGALAVNRIDQLFLLARASGQQAPADWAVHVLAILAAQGQHVVKDGAALASIGEEQAELTRRATVFATKQLPVLRAAGIAH
jgi:SAM-dependent methyltransferase